MVFLLGELQTWQTVVFSAFCVLSLSYVMKRLFGPYTVKTKLYCLDSAFNNAIKERCTSLAKEFKIPGWASNNHVQTALSPYILRSDVSWQREIVKLSDGGIISLDWAMKNLGNRKKSDPVLVVLPGLTGDKHSVSTVSKLAVERGYWAVVFNKRGYGNTAILTPKLQSFADTSDLKEIVEHIRRQFPDSEITAYGSSAGSALLAAYLGKYGKSSDVSASVLNCPGYNSEVLMRDCIHQPYNYVLLRSLKKIVEQHRDKLSEVVDMDAAMKSTSLLEFEEKLFCKIYGYSTMKEYWDKNDPLANVENAVTPILLINSLDDPICVKENIPWHIFQTYDKFILLTTEKGGHCGFMQYPRLDNWSDSVSMDYIASVLAYKTKIGFEDGSV